MIVRKDSFDGESRHASLARRLENVADIRRRAYVSRPVHQRLEAGRLTIVVDENPPGQDAA